MSERWSDLTTRLVSAFALLAVAVGAAVLGRIAFSLLVGGVCGAMAWELMRMHAPRFEHAALLTGIMTVLALFAGLVVALRGGFVVTILGFALVGVIGALWATRDRLICGLYLFGVLLSGFVIAGLFSGGSNILLVLLLAVVIVTDVAGYFVGRLVGGPKFWPTISPKKTWSGVAAGWVAAVALGLYVATFTGTPISSLSGAQWLVVLLAFAMSFGSQMGDIAESAIKRRAGVKDSSDLIPGHGGFLDRFDGVLGAALVAFPFMWL